MALGGCRRVNLGPLQATVPPLRQEARSQQVSVEGQVEEQAAAAVPQLVEYTTRVGRPL